MDKAFLSIVASNFFLSLKRNACYRVQYGVEPLCWRVGVKSCSSVVENPACCVVVEHFLEPSKTVIQRQIKG